MIRPARPASTVCLLRDGGDGLEVLMVQRGPSARFMADAWVFPGGLVDEVDRQPDTARLMAGVEDPDEVPWLSAALRELAEEAAVWLTDGPIEAAPDPRPLGADVYAHLAATGVRFDASRLAYFSNWITPTVIPMRFDTRFYAAAGNGVELPDPDPRELSDHDWIRPSDAIDLAVSGARTIPFPTLKNLAFFRRFAGADEALTAIRAEAEVVPVQPRGRIGPDGSVEVVLPWDPGYDELGDADPGDVDLAKAVSARGVDSLAEFTDNEG